MNIEKAKNYACFENMYNFFIFYAYIFIVISSNKINNSTIENKKDFIPKTRKIFTFSEYDEILFIIIRRLNIVN